MSKILVIGAGAWGTALANVLAKKKNKVYVWARNSIIVSEINNKSSNKKYFKDLQLSKKLKAITGKIDTKEFDFIFYVLPASQFENFSQSYLANQKIKNFIICSKGLSESGKLLSEIATKSLNITKIFILSGPSFAKEVITGMPTALSLASNNQKPLQTSALFKDTNIRIYYSNNIKTLEVLGVVKNIYAIGAGILEAMKLGENARASFITRCASEMQFMLKQSNLNDQKILSLAGIGDLVLTCSSTKSRNFSFGKKFIFMQSTKNFSKNKTTIEGLNSIMTIKKVLNLNLKDLPILTSIINVIKGKSVKNEVNNLLRRKFKYE